MKVSSLFLEYNQKNHPQNMVAGSRLRLPRFAQNGISLQINYENAPAKIT